MSELTREACLEEEIARLTLALRNAHKDSMEMSIDRAKAVKENAALRAKVEEYCNEAVHLQGQVDQRDEQIASLNSSLTILPRTKDLEQQLSTARAAVDSLVDALKMVLSSWVNGREVRDGIPLSVLQQAQRAVSLTQQAQGKAENVSRKGNHDRRGAGERSAMGP